MVEEKRGSLVHPPFHFPSKIPIQYFFLSGITGICRWCGGHVGVSVGDGNKEDRTLLNLTLFHKCLRKNVNVFLFTIYWKTGEGFAFREGN